MPSPLLPLLAAALLGASTPDPGAGGGDGPAPAAGTASSEAPGAAAAHAGAAEAAALAPRGRSWFAFPVAFWLPETKLGLAAAAGVHFDVSQGAGDSNAFLVAGYTMLGQSTADVASDLSLKNGTLVTGRFRFAYYPDVFYGIGPSTTLDDREDVTRRFGEAIVTAELPVAHGLRLGPRVHGRVEEVLDVTEGGLLATGTVPGSDGFSALGLGLQATWDSRDHQLWPTRGGFAQLWYVRYPAGLAHGAEAFYRGAAEARLFVPLGKERVLGLAALLEHADAATPFSIMPKIGSTRYLRGIREGRFRDAIAWAGQAEVRVPFSRRFAATAFGALGDVAPSLAAQRADTIKLAGGAGLRYRLTDRGANLRLDAALSGEGGVEVYVLLLEAF
ncbi:MAG TPA: BamA/TamA family outer membrane protein [Anaeromyxobacter sp.]|nr:BamA/TamA family outer membrane protein [Anaeromyxobacter sp.]